MSDIIRVDLTPDEARHLQVLIGVRCPVCIEVGAKLTKAQANPLNGPTFDFARHSDDEIEDEPSGVCLLDGIDPKDAAIDAEDTARLDEEHEAFEKIPDDEIPY